MSAEDWGKFGEIYSKKSTLLSVPTLYSKIAASIISEDCQLHHQDEPITFLDVAAGPGVLSLALLETLRENSFNLRKGSVFQVTDFASGMVDAARNKLASIEHTKLGISEIQYFQMDACNPDQIAPSSVTYLGCMFGVMFFPDVPKSLRELHSKLKSGGRAIVSSWFDAEISALLSDFNEFLGGSAVPNAMTTLPCHDPHELESQLVAAGFQNVQVQQIPNTFQMINNEGFYQGLFSNPVMIQKFPAILNYDKSQLPAQWKAFLTLGTSSYAERWLSKEDPNVLCLKWIGNLAIANY